MPQVPTVPTDRMPEAEVSLRLAFYLIEAGMTTATVTVAIDGAQIRTGTSVHFKIKEFMHEHGWRNTGDPDVWQADYVSQAGGRIRVHSKPGVGDVVAQLGSGDTLRVECKKGSLAKSKSSEEYPLVREALGQLLTMREVAPDDILAVAVPRSPKFSELAERWREAPLIQRFGIRILTVGRDGKVEGL